MITAKVNGVEVPVHHPLVPHRKKKYSWLPALFMRWERFRIEWQGPEVDMGCVEFDEPIPNGAQVIISYDDIPLVGINITE